MTMGSLFSEAAKRASAGAAQGVAKQSAQAAAKSAANKVGQDTVKRSAASALEQGVGSSIRQQATDTAKQQLRQSVKHAPKKLSGAHSEARDEPRKNGTVKDIGKTAWEAAKGAASGYVTGDAVGAVSGAVVGGGGALLKSKTGKKLIGGIAAIAVAIGVIPIAGLGVGALAVSSTVDQVTSSQAWKAASGFLSTADDLGQARDDVLAAAKDCGMGGPLCIAASLNPPEGKAPGSFVADNHFLTTLTAGVGPVSNILSGQLRLPGSDPDGPLWRPADDGDPGSLSLLEAAAQTRDQYIAQLMEMGYGEAGAGVVFDTALTWMRGDSGNCPAPNDPTEQTGETGIADDPAAFTARQQELAGIIVGTAKTMFGDDWEQAARTGLLIAYTETRLRVLANDGVLEDVPGFAAETQRTDEFPAEYYPIVAKTMDMSNDGSGSAFLAVGMFQQMAHNDTWTAAGESTFTSDQQATLERSMEPTWQAYAFFRQMQNVDGWQSMNAAELGEKVQVSGRLDATMEALPLADTMLDLYGSADAIALHPDAKDPEVSGDKGHSGNNGSMCSSSGTGTAMDDVDISTEGWARPSQGVLTSGFGWRPGFEADFAANHSGIDLSAGCGAPLVSAYDGVVKGVFQDSFGANAIEIDHGSGVVSRYFHMLEPSHLKPGDQVVAGQQVGKEGNTGFSFGCHLHFEIQVNGTFIDPQPFLTERGIDV